MKNKRGFTLLEVVISTAILGMIAVVVLSLFSLQFKTIVNTRFLTKDVYAAQQTMETTISDIQKAIQSDSDPGGSEVEYSLFDEVYSGTFQRTVYGYPRTIELGDSERMFYAVVADYTRDEFEVPSITVAIELSDLSLVAGDDVRSSLSVQSDYELIDNPHGVFSENVYHWYVSRPGFYTPLESGASELEIGTMYPVFPDDYSMISLARDPNFTGNLANYAGRHIVCTATPAAYSGKAGAQAISNPVYIPGLPVTSGLKQHLDASLIDKDDTANSVRVSGSDYYVKRWSNNFGDSYPATQANDSLQPLLYSEKTGDFEYGHNVYESWVKYLSFDGNNDYLNTSAIGTYGTVFVVARSAGEEVFTIYDSTSGWDPSILSFYSGQVFLGRDRNTLDDYSNCDIAEVIIYNRALTEDEIASVEDYLADKYTPVPPVISIYSLQSLSFNILKGQSFDMPETVTAYWTNGHISSQGVISWSPAAVDINTPGVQTFEGTVQGTDIKASLTVTVINATIVSLEDMEVTVEQNSDFDMPSKVVANLSDGSTMDVAVTWSPASISTATITNEIPLTSTGTSVFDSSKSMTLTVNVVGKLATGITLSPSTLSLALGETEALTATVTPADAANKSVGWSSSDTAVATVDSNGTVTAVGYGNATITARTQDGSNLSATCPVNVATIELTGIGAISGTAKVGQMLTAGAVTPSGATVTYQWMKCSTSGGTYTNISGATSSTYTLTGNDYNYYIKVMATGYGHYSGSVASIYKGPVTACALTGVSISGTAQVGVTLTAELSPEGATATYQWQRSYSGYSYSNIIGATASTYTPTAGDFDYSIRVVATGSNGYTGTVTSSPTDWVAACPLTGISITGTAQVGQTLTGVVSPDGATATYRWQRSSDGSNYSDISYATGSTYTLTSSDLNCFIRVRAIGSGTYTGTVYSASIGRVTAHAITGIGDISGTTRVGQTLQAGAVTPNGATVSYQWSRSDSAYGTYSNILYATGSTYNLTSSDLDCYIKVTATGTGSYSGSVTSDYVGPISGIPVTSVNITQSSVTLNKGASTTLTATVYPANATNKDVTWSSSNTAVATVSGSGVVYAAGGGTATITVRTSDGGFTDTCTVTVNVRVTGVSLPGTLSIDKGDTSTLTATVSPSDATDQRVTWYSSNTTVATVSSSGVVTANAGGTATITVWTSDGGYSDSCTVTVTVPVTSVNITQSSVTLNNGASTTLTATVYPTDATNKNVTWSSSNNAVATVNSSGRVTAFGGGTATITVRTSDGGFTDTCTVTVNVSVTGVRLTPSSVTLARGDTRTLTATISPADATDQRVTWSSNNTTVATISSTGVVTAAQRGGTATITVRTTDGGYTDTCTVTVSPYATTISDGNKNRFTLTFDSTVSSASINTTGVTITPNPVSGTTVTFSRGSNYTDGASYNVSVTYSDGTTSTITVSRSGNNWSITNQT